MIFTFIRHNIYEEMNAGLKKIKILKELISQTKTLKTDFNGI